MQVLSNSTKMFFTSPQSSLGFVLVVKQLIAVHSDTLLNKKRSDENEPFKFVCGFLKSAQ